MPDLTVFICYRRSDASAQAGRIYEALRRRFGRENLFIDVDALRPGEDWVEAIQAAVVDCDVLLAVVGPSWAGASNDAGTRRLFDEFDRVRLEIEAALRANKAVIPVLVDGATMPASSELPESLKPLLRRHAVGVSHTSFESDMTALVRALRAIDRDRERSVAPRPAPPITAAARAAPSPPAPRPPGEAVEGSVPVRPPAPKLASNETGRTSLTRQSPRGGPSAIVPALAVGAVLMLAVAAVGIYVISNPGGGASPTPTRAAVASSVTSASLAPTPTSTPTVTPSPTLPPSPSPTPPPMTFDHLMTWISLCCRQADGTPKTGTDLATCKEIPPEDPQHWLRKAAIEVRCTQKDALDDGPPIEYAVLRQYALFPDLAKVTEVYAGLVAVENAVRNFGKCPYGGDKIGSLPAETYWKYLQSDAEAGRKLCVENDVESHLPFLIFTANHALIIGYVGRITEADPATAYDLHAAFVKHVGVLPPPTPQPSP